MDAVVHDTVATAFREEWGQVVATLIRLTGDWDLAEECAQDAFTAALRRWRSDGIPDRPGAWLTTTARNRAADVLRRRAVGEARVALTLRTLAGLSTAEIARAFLVSERAMSKRLTRAKRKIRHAGIPYRVPPAHLLPKRTPALLAVLYLLFNEGYSATAGDTLVRHDLCAEAIRLARVLCTLLPDEPEAAGLLALMLLHDARRAARLDDAGDFVPLDEQDRTRWDTATIADGTAVLDGALHRGRPGPYQVQAAIAACHATATTAANTDWAQIATLYGQLLTCAPSPVVELNRAVAVGMSEGPAAGLALVDELAARHGTGALAGYHLLPATRAELLRRLGRHTEAAAAYREALDLAGTDTERRYLRRRLAETT